MMSLDAGLMQHKPMQLDLAGISLGCCLLKSWVEYSVLGLMDAFISNK